MTSTTRSTRIQNLPDLNNKEKPLYEKLKELRIYFGFSQKEMAGKLKLKGGKTYISNLEGGKFPIRNQLAAAWLAECGHKIDEIRIVPMTPQDYKEMEKQKRNTNRTTKKKNQNKK